MKAIRMPSLEEALDALEGRRELTTEDGVWPAEVAEDLVRLGHNGALVSFSGETRWCPRCEREVPVEQWSIARSRRNYCRECAAAYNRDWWAQRRTRSRE